VERYEEVLKAIFFVKLLQIADLLGLADNGWPVWVSCRCIGAACVFALVLDDRRVAF